MLGAKAAAVETVLEARMPLEGSPEPMTKNKRRHLSFFASKADKADTSGKTAPRYEIQDVLSIRTWLTVSVISGGMRAIPRISSKTSQNRRRERIGFRPYI